MVRLPRSGLGGTLPLATRRTRDAECVSTGVTGDPEHSPTWLVGNDASAHARRFANTFGLMMPEEKFLALDRDDHCPVRPSLEKSAR